MTVAESNDPKAVHVVIKISHNGASVRCRKGELAMRSLLLLPSLGFAVAANAEAASGRVFLDENRLEISIDIAPSFY